uniref:7TM_GPCR_Srx domain-containing protein n=1 Tax=Rhabditophanes sp. KR3021 TaxID=114890 RepID=A0AC35U1Z6_9BILA
MNVVTILDITHIVILCISIVLYLFCIYSIFKSPSLHNSFGYIFLILCVGAILQSLISIIYQNLYDYVFPSIISYKNITIASFDNLLIKIIANCHLFLVINRLISLFFPIFYHHWFTKSTSFIFALFPIILGIVFEYKRNWCSKINVLWLTIDYIYLISMFNFISDCILLSKIYKHIKTKKKSQNPKFWTKENRFSCHCICLNVFICFILQPIIFIVCNTDVFKLFKQNIKNQMSNKVYG